MLNTSTIQERKLRTNEMIGHFIKEKINYERDETDKERFIWLEVPREVSVETNSQIQKAGWNIFSIRLLTKEGKTGIHLYMKIGLTTL